MSLLALAIIFTWISYKTVWRRKSVIMFLIFTIHYPFYLRHCQHHIAFTPPNTDLSAFPLILLKVYPRCNPWRWDLLTRDQHTGNPMHPPHQSLALEKKSPLLYLVPFPLLLWLLERIASTSQTSSTSYHNHPSTLNISLDLYLSPSHGECTLPPGSRRRMESKCFFMYCK